MDYFAAVQEGRDRVKRAVDLLQEVAGSASPVLFLKMDVENWTPVGEESLFSVVDGKNGTAAVVVCDEDGNAKAISAWVSAEQAENYARAMESKGLPRFRGEVRLPI